MILFHNKVLTLQSTNECTNDKHVSIILRNRINEEENNKKINCGYLIWETEKRYTRLESACCLCTRIPPLFCNCFCVPPFKRFR